MNKSLKDLKQNSLNESGLWNTMKDFVKSNPNNPVVKESKIWAQKNTIQNNTASKIVSS